MGSKWNGTAALCMHVNLGSCYTCRTTALKKLLFEHSLPFSKKAFQMPSVRCSSFRCVGENGCKRERISLPQGHVCFCMRIHNV